MPRGLEADLRQFADVRSEPGTAILCLVGDRLRGLQKDLIVRKIKKLARAGKW